MTEGLAYRNYSRAGELTGAMSETVLADVAVGIAIALSTEHAGELPGLRV